MKKNYRLNYSTMERCDNPNYLLGAKVLAFIAPPSKTEKVIKFLMEINKKLKLSV